MKKSLDIIRLILQKSLFILLISLTCVTLLAGCRKRPEYYGYSFRDSSNLEKILAKIVPGKSDELEVLNLLGSPTFLSEFTPRTFFYTQIAVARNRITGAGSIGEVRTLAIEFTPDTRMVTRVWVEDVAKVHNLAYVEDETIIKGNRPSVFQQILGNIGKFNKEENRYDNDF